MNVVSNRYDMVSSAYEIPGTQFVFMAFDYTIFAVYTDNMLEIRLAWPDACRISKFISDQGLRNMMEYSATMVVQSIEEECKYAHYQYHRGVETVPLPQIRQIGIASKIDLSKKRRRIAER